MSKRNTRKNTELAIIANYCYITKKSKSHIEVLREIARFILLYKDKPEINETRRWEVMEEIEILLGVNVGQRDKLENLYSICTNNLVLKALPIKKMQLHELKIIALQYLGSKKMGWRLSLDKLIDKSWPTIRPLRWVSNRHHGQLIKTKKEMKSICRKFISQISERPNQYIPLFTDSVKQWTWPC